MLKTELPAPVLAHQAWAAVHETHIGVIFLVGERAYKMKKPVDLGFLDFTTRERREHVCRQEVALNRRLAPDVYLGVSDVTAPDGTVCDHLVVMRRMPEDRRLSTLVAEGEPLAKTVWALARLLASFHAAAERSPQIDADGTRDAIRDRWRASFTQVRPFHNDVVDAAVATEIEQLAEEFLAGREALFTRRIAEGRVVDGHGDLLADDIFCLDDGPRVLDCLEFDDHLRHVDGVDDVAFLAMDFEQLGAPELGTLLLDQYAEFSGDPAPPSLRHHYRAYRAFVRVKVACLRHAQGDEEAAPLALRYAAIALEHLRQARVRLVLVGGLPGSGKSTLAGGLADQLGATLLQADRVRKELAGLTPTDHATDDYEQGLYDPAHTERTYAELSRRASELLELGETVVLDASWTAAERRAAVIDVALRAHAEVVALRCWAPDATTAERLASRVDSISDATGDIAARLSADTDPWPDAHTVTTTGTPQDSLTEALDRADLGPLRTY